MNVPRLGADQLVNGLTAYAEALEQHRETLNRLNVFPVPDGDTGTNMALTARAAIDELAARRSAGMLSEDAAAIAAALAHGALMGARGNSGVILCQVLRALAAAVPEDPDGLGAGELAAAIEAASAAARSAVLRPAEGTILTVAADAAAAAGAAAADGAGLLEVLDAATAGAQRGLWRTPELLSLLADAGVVDAGGAGLFLLFPALGTALDGRPIPAEIPLPPAVAAVIAAGGVRARPAEVGANGHQDGPRFEVMYLLEAPDESIEGFKEAWATLGDSIVVVGGGGLFNCHVHTDEIGAAIEAALDVGRPRQIRVTDLAEQVEEERWVREVGESAPPPPSGPRPRTSVVAVANGEGVRRIFRSLGVTELVAGGQSMNPSTADLLAAVEESAGEEVVILPNNGNIIPVANQVVHAARKPVRVVPTKGIQEGFAALLEYDPQAPSEDNAKAMQEAACRVVAGEVTRAVRASESPVGPIHAGDFIGLSRGGIESVATTVVEATTGLLACLLRAEHEIVTLIEGEGSRVGDTRKVTEWLHAAYPTITVEEHRGGQPLYPYLISIE